MTTRTVVELRRDGALVVFHRRGDLAWTHPVGERGRYRSYRNANSRAWKWVEVPCDCPVERPLERPWSAQDLDGGAAEGDGRGAS